MNLIEISKKELQSLFKRLSEYYGVDIKFLEQLLKKYVFFKNKKGKVYIIPKSIYRYINIKNVNRYGLYIFTIDKNGIRFSIEGSQIFYKHISKRKLELDINKWFSEDYIDVNKKLERGFYIIVNGKDIAGSGYFSNGVVKSFIPKNRKLLKSVKKLQSEKQ